ncbi:protein containing SprB repeat, partial [Lentimicrobium saccharophilum]
MFKVLKHILLIVTVLAGAFHASGQIAMPDQVCVGATKNYWVDETPGSTYNWAIDGNVQPVTGHLLTVTWDTPGNYTITVQETSADGCLGEVRTGEVIVSDNLPVSVQLSVSQNPVCIGNDVIFTATPVNGGTNPVFSWFVNGVQVLVGSQDTYTYAPGNGDEVFVELLSDEACATGNPAISETMLMQVDPLLPVTVSIDALPSFICEGTEITLTASPVNGGTNPVFSWFVDAGSGFVGVQTGPDNFYTFTPAGGEQVYVELLSDVNCGSGNPAASEVIQVTVSPLLQASVSIVVDNDDICAGTEASFTATPVNGGTNPVFAWYVNTVPVPGETSATYSYTPANGDVVEATLVSDEPCVSPGPVTSNVINMTVNQLALVSVGISADANPVCQGGEVTFTATYSNGGPNPEFVWFVNGIMAGLNQDTYTYVPANGDEVQVVLLSDDECVTGNPATSNLITMEVSDQLEVAVAITAGTVNLCAGETVIIAATPDNGGTAPVYAWYVNTVLDAGQTGDTYIYVPSDGDVVYAELTSSETCTTNNPAASNALTFTVNEIPTLSATGIDPLNCGEEGSIEFTFTNVPDGTYDIVYTTGTFTGVNVVAGTAVVTAPAGIYEDLSITVGLCASAEDVDITLTAPDAPTLAAIGIDPLNCGEDGSIEFTFTNVPDGTYDIVYATGTFTGVTITGNSATVTAPAGLYEDLTITVGLCASAEDVDITLTAPDAPTLSAIGTDPLNCGEDGSIEFAFTNVPDGTYDIVYASGTFTGVNVAAGAAVVTAPAGIYEDLSITVGLCTSTEDVDITLTAPDAPTLAAVGIDPLNCGEDGSIEFTFTNVPDGTYDIVYATGTFTGVTVAAGTAVVTAPAGIYDDLSITVGLCTSVDDVDVTITAPVGATITDVAFTDANCGNNDGTITITATGGTAPLEYSIDGGLSWSALNVFTGLTPGTYNIVVRDAALCETFWPDEVIINNTGGAEITDVISTDANCGSNDGTITITATGGTTPLEYSIDGGLSWSAVNVFTGLLPGTYSIVVRDAALCATLWPDEVIINNTGGAEITEVIATNANCGNNDGTITITATGGTAPLEYSIDGGLSWSSVNVFTGLLPGTYSIVVRDAALCATIWPDEVIINNTGGAEITDVVAT